MTGKFRDKGARAAAMWNMAAGAGVANSVKDLTEFRNGGTIDSDFKNGGWLNNYK